MQYVSQMVNDHWLFQKVADLISATATSKRSTLTNTVSMVNAIAGMKYMVQI